MQRRQWFDSQIDLETDLFAFIEAIWAANNMTRRQGNCTEGERMPVGFASSHRKTTTLVAGLCE